MYIIKCSRPVFASATSLLAIVGLHNLIAQRKTTAKSPHSEKLHWGNLFQDP